MRRLLIVLLSLGAISGFTAGALHLAYGPCSFGHERSGGRHAHFEQHIAEVCVRAARDVNSESPGSRSTPPEP